ncbi:MAG TPA: hypothetical protein VGF45_07790 [Polyangia bacterium]
MSVDVFTEIVIGRPLAAPFMAFALRRANRKDLRRLKQRLEAACPT